MKPAILELTMMLCAIGLNASAGEITTKPIRINARFVIEKQVKEHRLQTLTYPVKDEKGNIVMHTMEYMYTVCKPVWETRTREIAIQLKESDQGDETGEWEETFDLGSVIIKSPKLITANLTLIHKVTGQLTALAYLRNSEMETDRKSVV